jgi:protein O-mannosyl-transferase
VLSALYSLVLVALHYGGHDGVRRHQIEAGIIILIVAGIATLLAGRASVPAVSPADVALTGRQRWAVCVVAVVGAAALVPALHVGFLSDDYVLRAWASSRNTMPEGYSFARPVALLLWSLVLGLGGAEAGIHSLNLVLHGFNALMVWALARECRLSSRASAVAALVFLIWPTQVEPVYWAAGIFDVLMASGVLTCLWLALRYLDAGVYHWPLLAAVAVCSLLALFTKETAICLPGLWLCTATAHHGRLPRRTRRFWVVLIVLAACVAAYLSMRVAFDLPLSTGASLTRYVLKEQVSRTLAALALPFSTPVLTSHPWIPVVMAALFLTLAVTVSTQREEPRAPIVALSGLVWAVLAAAPTIGYLFIGTDLDGSRYLYLPAVGWGLFIGGAMDVTLPSGMRTAVQALAIAALLAILWGQKRLTYQWREVSNVRDRLVNQGVMLLEREPCSLVSAEGIPTRHKGAQLFSNGYVEAVRQRTPKATAGPSCRLVWDGAGLRRQ